MKFLICVLISLAALCGRHTQAQLNVVSEGNVPSAPLPNNGAVDEVVVESSLHIKPKPMTMVRRSRSIPIAMMMSALVEHKRVKRQPQRRGQQEPQYGQSQAAANAAANSNYNNRFTGEFGSSAANAQSQAFNAQGPAGSFGASSAGTVTQALNANKFGLQNSAAASMSQAFHLPNGQTINFAATNSFANGGAGNNANSRGAAVTVSKG